MNVTRFGQVLHAEWTKFRTVRGWVAGLAVAGLAIVLVGLVAAGGSSRECVGPHGKACPTDFSGPVGPDGQAVTDSFSFVHRRLVGDGSLTVRVASLTGSTGRKAEPWAKAGLIVKRNTRQGSAYAAIMLTASHGVRMQYDFTHDTAGPATAHWLRLVRHGATVTGYASEDGTQWTKVGSAQLAGLPKAVPAGLFVASPQHVTSTQTVGSFSTTGFGTTARATFDHVSGSAAGNWHGSTIGDGPPGAGYIRSGGTFTVSGSGDIAPAAASHDMVEGSLVGTFAGLIVVIVCGAMFVTAEYRRGLIRTTLAATPRRGRVLAAKALVLGGVTFLAALAASALAFWVVGRLRRDHGMVILPVPTLTELRVVAGTAALLAVSAVLALAVGAILRRSAGAVATAVVLLVLPYILGIASLLPAGPAQWLLRITPAAGFAIQQSIRQYAQVADTYTPPNGYYPLPPWAGFGVLCAWTVLALGLAVVLIRRRDA